MNVVLWLEYILSVPSTALTMLVWQQKACKAPDPGSLVEDIA